MRVATHAAGQQGLRRMRQRTRAAVQEMCCPARRGPWARACRPRGRRWQDVGNSLIGRKSAACAAGSIDAVRFIWIDSNLDLPPSTGNRGVPARWRGRPMTGRAIAAAHSRPLAWNRMSLSFRPRHRSGTRPTRGSAGARPCAAGSGLWRSLAATGLAS